MGPSARRWAPVAPRTLWRELDRGTSLRRDQRVLSTGPWSGDTTCCKHGSIRATRPTETMSHVTALSRALYTRLQALCRTIPCTPRGMLAWND